ncbi:tRNA (adenosine(37)-N6)-threonylcarbamoyltransferase complex ATPase subunit type 1 TsaE [Hahella sp. SMD15-11]|uniref:tRNA threonylcarbamoyladenosine biosynthesis protein TsaE n=1 Tax=Thermohahella caldifontis TaxID=3142973 RepID=A0AB39V000_9GAMM
MNTTAELILESEAGTEKLGAALAHVVQAPATVFLEGTLGAGKTTLVRYWLRALGHSGAVKSPTYTLVEPYELDGVTLYHFDLYRLGDPEELEYMGMRDYFDSESLRLIEWAERGQGLLPEPDWLIRLVPEGSRRRITLQGPAAQAVANRMTEHASD